MWSLSPPNVVLELVLLRLNHVNLDLRGKPYFHQNVLDTPKHNQTHTHVLACARSTLTLVETEQPYEVRPETCYLPPLMESVTICCASNDAWEREDGCYRSPMSVTIPTREMGRRVCEVGQGRTAAVQFGKNCE